MNILYFRSDLDPDPCFSEDPDSFGIRIKIERICNTYILRYLFHYPGSGSLGSAPDPGNLKNNEYATIRSRVASSACTDSLSVVTSVRHRLNDTFGESQNLPQIYTY